MIKEKTKELLKAYIILIAFITLTSGAIFVVLHFVIKYW